MAPDAEHRPGQKGGVQNGLAGGQVEAQPTAVARYEYVVRWRRADWSTTTKSKGRKFDREAAARRFVVKLQQPHPNSPWNYWAPAIISVDRRPVGEWERRYDWDGRP